MRNSMGVPPAAGFAVLHLIAVLAGARTTLGDPGLPMIWPAAGVAVLWLVNRRESRWRWVDMVAIGVITFGGLAAAGAGIEVALLEIAPAMVGPMVFIVAAGRWLPGLWAGPDGGRSLARLGELWRLLLCAALASVTGTLLHVVGELAAGADGGFSGLGTVTRLVRDTVAVVLFGVALRRIGHLHRNRWAELRGLGRDRWLECSAIVAVSGVAYWYVFSSHEDLPVGFLLIPLTVWAALRMPTSVAIVHVVVFGFVALLYTIGGHGPYARVADIGTTALLIQLYVGIVGAVGFALALVRDERDSLIQRLKVSEQEATDRATMMTTVVDSMTEGLAILDHTGRLVLRNPAAGRLLGSASSVTGTVALGSDHGFFRPDGTPLTDAELPHVRALAGEDAAPMDVLVRNAAVPEGRVVRFNVARLALVTGPYHVVVVFHDVTADRRHRDELMSFAGRVAHNLLNPLTTIEGWSEVLEQELAGYQPAERVERIQRASARMRTFLNGLLSYTAARDGKLMPTTVNLALLVGDIVNSRLDHAESTGAAPPYFEVGRLDPVDADPVLLRQLLENLIDNSLRMMAPGVGPYLAISCQPAPKRMVRIDILDNSVGIPPGKRHEIWTNFHRDKGSDSNGLELAICKRIVERHGGTIEAVANPHGTGNRMSFTLPAGRSAYARALAPTR
ncbi:phospho-acceptor domain-containing protein [Actinoplanes italicus]|uniref:Sensor-like histidine kinase SenX3 n=2 Tax=Actinoplanes italicus TaxID=113567 RepID=A0A2T0K9H0_9ACTN|nr:phospho-acceptor domain-containing protein [Actinoplanes italicus]